MQRFKSGVVFFSFLGMVGLLSNSVAQGTAPQAAPICDTIANCQALRSRVEARIRELQGDQSRPVYTRVSPSPRSRRHAFYPDISQANLGAGALRDETGLIWGAVEKNADGQARMVSWYDAAEACLHRNPRSEFARVRDAVDQYARGNGELPRNAIRLPTVQELARLAGYMGAEFPDSNGDGRIEIVDFLAPRNQPNYREQLPSPLNSANSWLWSLDFRARERRRELEMAYWMSPVNGQIFYSRTVQPAAFRCVWY